MKVVLFCGGLGTRIRDYSESVPKPMIHIGYRPVLWHLMKYYAHYGHTEFVLCLGYRGDAVKQYFLDYNECLSNDFVLSEGGRRVELVGKDIENWKISFVDTGLHANVGERLRAVRRYVANDEMFLANYADGLTDLDLGAYVEWFRKQGKTAALLAVRPTYTFHLVALNGESGVRGITDFGEAGLWINGGFFVFRKAIFDYLEEGEDLVQAPFARLTGKDQLVAYKHHGFWACMDTFKDKQRFDDMYATGDRPWEVWSREPRP
jgi:glucose-1-phosphate cytidylyltransferase